jgi:hypothetical protein
VNIQRSPILILLRYSGRLLDRLIELWPDIPVYVVSFVTLNVYWLAHHRIFRTEHPYSIPGETLAARCNGFELARADPIWATFVIVRFFAALLLRFKFEFILIQSQAENMH